jgi:hypothetical protein
MRIELINSYASLENLKIAFLGTTSALNFIVGEAHDNVCLSLNMCVVYVPIYFIYNFLLILYHFWLMYMNHIYMHNNIYVCGQKCGEMSLAIKRNALVAFLAQQSSESIPSTLDRRPTGHHSLVCGG